MKACALKPRERTRGRLAVDGDGSTLKITTDTGEYVTDGLEAVLAGSVDCGGVTIQLTDDELDWVYLHAS